LTGRNELLGVIASHSEEGGRACTANPCGGAEKVVTFAAIHSLSNTKMLLLTPSV